MDRLEQANRDLAVEVRALKDELAVSRSSAPAVNAALPPTTSNNDAPQVAAAVPLEERVNAQQTQLEDLAQTKVQTSQRLPVTLTGMVLFNAFSNGRNSGTQQDPTMASLSNTASSGGASLSQTIVGLTFQGPHVFGGGQVNGDAQMDFAGGTASSLNHLVRLRVATVRIDWKNQSLIFGQDKPIISPRDPSSLAQVAVSPLTGAGNPWLWQPQVKFEQRFTFNEDMGIRAQAGIYQTSEPSASAGAEYASTLSPSRPAFEGRAMLWKNLWHGARLEIAPGVHLSQTHVAGLSVPSHLFSVDWMIQPAPKLQWTGMFFTGQNAAGIGALRQGFTIFPDGIAQAVATGGGWTQFSYFATSRLTFNVYGGQESNHAADLLASEITRNLVYAANFSYRLGQNVLMGVEGAQARTNYLGLTTRQTTHYDLAVAYLF